MQSKYVIFNEQGIETPYLFHERIQHKDFARKMGDKVVSAGFAMAYEDKGEIKFLAHGSSTSLMIDSRKQDEEILSRTFGLQ